MLEYVTNTLQQVASEPLGLIFALFLGVVSAATSACCTLPALGILVGYSGARVEANRKDVFKSALLFTLGTILSLIIIGGIAGFVGQVAQNVLGRYWKVFAGIVAVFFGLATLKLLPFKLSLGNHGKAMHSSGKIGTILAGLIMGGIVAVSSLPCNPGIFHGKEVQRPHHRGCGPGAGFNKRETKDSLDTNSQETHKSRSFCRLYAADNLWKNRPVCLFCRPHT